LNLILLISVILISGLIFGRLVKFIKLPNVTGYLLAGLFLGPHILNILGEETYLSISIVSEMALAFIAFTIGLSFKRSYFRRVGFSPVVIALTQSLAAIVLIQGVLILLGFDKSVAIVLGAIATATAPAATIMVIKQYNARGPVTDMLMSVVAIDDAIALIAFGFSITIVKNMAGGDISFLASVIEPLLEVLFAILIGGIMGLITKIPLYFFKKSGNRLIILIASVFLTHAIASIAEVSTLLACMMQGAIFCNISADSDSMNDIADNFTPPLFLMFFVISGSHLNISTIPKIGLIGILYIVLRAAGKWFGAYLGAKIMKTPKEIQRYLGPTLFPQAGVAIGLSLVATNVIPEYSQTITAVVLCATLVYEIFGPIITKISLIKAGEIKQ